MISYRIEYVGPGMSGRTTSLIRVLRAAGVDADATRGPAPQTFAWQVADGPASLIAGVSAVRGHLWYDDPTDPRLDRAVALEIDRLVRADGLVFVIDSQRGRADANIEAWERLRRDLASRGVDLDAKPVVFQINKRDLMDLCSLEWARERFHVPRCAYFESIATSGVGAVEAVEELLRLIARRPGPT